MEPDKYQHYLAEDFAKDEAFIRWVLYQAPVDEAAWKTFILAHPHKAIEIDEAKSWINEVRQGVLFSRLTEEEKRSMHGQLLRALKRPDSGREANHPVRLAVLRWAAVVALLMVCGYSLFALIGGMSGYQVYDTAFGETRTLSLPDGSMVRLNANSRLKFDSDWEAGQDRDVWLVGEAYFEVVKQPEACATFSVHTNDLVVQVLGTRFNVNTRHAKTRVVLNEGKINLLLPDSDRSAIQMSPGDMVDYTQKEKRLIQRKVNPELHSSWKEGIQVFEKTPLAEVIEKMEEIYGVTIHLQDTSLQQRKVTMGIPVEDVGIAMETIESMLGLKISPAGDAAFIVH
jgi:ferric-dicitrate binding protein FerR (iron transport regulator)